MLGKRRVITHVRINATAQVIRIIFLYLSRTMMRSKRLISSSSGAGSAPGSWGCWVFIVSFSEFMGLPIERGTKK